MSKRQLAVAAALLTLTALACKAQTPTPPTLPKPPAEPTRSTAAVPTKSPASTPTRSPAAEPTRPPSGGISGKLCYPGSQIPPMTIFAVDQATGKSYKAKSQDPNETRYRLEGVLPGTYVVYAWLDDSKLGGSYSRAVPCGLSVDCTDHSLIPVTVKVGQDVTGIDVCDWYGPPPPAPPK